MVGRRDDEPGIGRGGPAAGPGKGGIVGAGPGEHRYKVRFESPLSDFEWLASIDLECVCSGIASACKEHRLRTPELCRRLFRCGIISLTHPFRPSFPFKAPPKHGFHWVSTLGTFHASQEEGLGAQRGRSKAGQVPGRPCYVLALSRCYFSQLF